MATKPHFQNATAAYNQLKPKRMLVFVFRFCLCMLEFLAGDVCKIRDLFLVVKNNKMFAPLIFVIQRVQI